jgi:hypothetical protein
MFFLRVHFGPSHRSPRWPKDEPWEYDQPKMEREAIAIVTGESIKHIGELDAGIVRTTMSAGT